ncbi:MAG: hypothetical protein JW803_01765 [Endomicrobiales bacterium]|nr:hypothetical protein [Endomicrobiales bacterium]
MDFGVSFPYQMDVDGGQNMGAASISFKFSLVEDMVSVSFSNELGEKSYFLNAIYTKKLFGVGCNLNAGYLSAGAGNTRGEGSCGMSVEIPVKDFDVVGELISREGGRGNGLIGARYRIGDALFVAAGFLKDFELDSRKYTIGLHAEF